MEEGEVEVKWNSGVEMRKWNWNEEEVGKARKYT